MASVRLYLDIRRKKNTGKYPVKLYVRNKGRLIVPTDFDCLKENWSMEGFSKKEANYQAKNSRLRELIRKVEILFLEMETNGKIFSDKELKNKIIKL